MDIKTMLTKARIKLLLKHPFWGNLALYLEFKEAEIGMPLGTDYEHIFYNPELLKDWELDHLIFGITHEVLHACLDHFGRRGSRKRIKWNYATDASINPMLIDYKIGLPPKGIICDPQYKGMHAEAIYDKLPDFPEPKCPKCGSKSLKGKALDFKDPLVKVKFECKDCGHTWTDWVIPEDEEGEGIPIEGLPYGYGRFDKHFDPAKDNPQKAKELSQEWKRRVAQVASSCKLRGTLPGGLEQIIDEILEPTVNWRSVLSEFVIKAFKNNFRWCPPSKRHIYSNLILPSLRSEGLGDIVCMVDDSGSISDDELKAFMSEVQGILNSYDMNLHLIVHDVPVRNYEVYHKGDSLSGIKIIGRGGTSHVDAFKEIERRNIEPRCIVALTDLNTEFPKEAPDAPLLWVVPPRSKNHKIPFGEVLVINVYES